MRFIDCPICGKTKVASHSKQKYCSSTCANLSREDDFVGTEEWKELNRRSRRTENERARRVETIPVGAWEARA